ncbi:metal ABC transporter permease [Mycobacterium sp. SM1]|uniref:metal ABC transporter permease n=1 Tax=Mycobacterium sp. SM1 TaxID=2816243 RepID=UPI001BCEC6B6|nr:metal ABC transporter permease [Mycobacterium sp. SM1]MBS4727897.1 metal ABC transporter permease [Mycobacterium sp. SM1]
MFADYLLNAWQVATIVALVAPVVGFFIVLRGSAFAAHAVPEAAFAGAAGASLLGLSTIWGLGVFALGAALAIGMLGRRGRHDVVIALALVLMLGLGSLFLSWSSEYSLEIYSLLFGEVLGVSGSEIGITAVLGGVCLVAVAVLYRPLLLSSLVPEIAAARGVRGHRMDMAFLVVVALATTAAVPVTGALLMVSLSVGPPATARCLTSEPLRAMAVSVAIALATVWASIAAAYQTNWPIGFFVTAFAFGCYVLAHLVRVVRGRGLVTRARLETRGAAAGHAGTVIT